MSTAEFNQMLLNNTEFLKPFAITLTKDQESAKDLFQETILRALANKEKYFSGTNIRAWLYTIMRNIFINNYRRESKRLVVTDSSPNEYIIDHAGIAFNNAINNIIGKETEKAVNELPAIFKQPFVLYFEGYKYNEIADMLNEPLGTVKSRIHFARKLLKAKIQRN